MKYYPIVLLLASMLAIVAWEIVLIVLVQVR